MNEDNYKVMQNQVLGLAWLREAIGVGKNRNEVRLIPCKENMQGTN